MALTTANLQHNVIGSRREVTAEVTFDTSYPTGGEVGLKALLGLGIIDTLEAQPTDGLIFDYDYVNDKLKAEFPTGGGGVVPTTLIDPISATGAVTASAVDATRPTIDPGIYAEVGDTADLSSVTTRVRATGF